MRSWKHSGFSVDQSVRLEARDPEGVRRLLQYFLRCPFSQARMIEVTEAGKVIYEVKKLARLLGLKPFKVLADLLELKIFKDTDEFIDFSTAATVAKKHGVVAERL